jgi:VIT1/CCC1 family predicted Fe2+/Mn2+ transporter
MPLPSREDLMHEHRPEAVAERLKIRRSSQSVSDSVLGGTDGCITTFAIVTASVGAGFPAHVSLIMGFAKLLADGLSMAVSNYESIKAHREFIDEVRRREEHHIEHVPEGEREEIRQIFAGKGFEGEALEHIVDTMLMEEHGLQQTHPAPLKSAAVTFVAFVLIGAIPLLPLLIAPLGMTLQLYLSMALAGVVFFAIGSLKSLIFGLPALKAGLATLLTGGTAAGLAFLVGHLLRNAFGAA